MQTVCIEADTVFLAEMGVEKLYELAEIFLLVVRVRFLYGLLGNTLGKKGDDLVGKGRELGPYTFVIVHLGVVAGDDAGEEDEHRIDKSALFRCQGKLGQFVERGIMGKQLLERDAQLIVQALITHNERKCPCPTLLYLKDGTGLADEKGIGLDTEDAGIATELDFSFEAKRDVRGIYADGNNPVGIIAFQVFEMDIVAHNAMIAVLHNAHLGEFVLADFHYLLQRDGGYRFRFPFHPALWLTLL